MFNLFIFKLFKFTLIFNDYFIIKFDETDEYFDYITIHS